MTAVSMSVDALAEHLENDIWLSHPRYLPGYGPLTGRLHGSGPRTIAARLRLVCDRYIALAVHRLDSGFVCELDYDDDDDGDPWSPDTLPTGLILSRPGRDLVIPIVWTKRTVVFCPTVLNAKPIMVALGGAEAGENLTGTVARLAAEFFAGGVA